MLLESAPDSVVIVDEQGHILYCNSQTVKHFGYDRSELIGQPVETLIPERFRSRHGLHRRHYAAEPRTRPMGAGLDLLARRKDGSEFPVEISLAPISTPEGTLIYAAIRDITERLKVDTEFDRLRRQQELLLLSVGEGVLGVDAKGIINYANPAAAKILGYRAEELLGQAEHELFHKVRANGAPYSEDMCPIHRSVEDGTIHHATGEVFLRRGGSTFPVEYTSAPVREHGKIVGASVIFTDVSERQKVEDVQRSAQSRVFDLYENLPEPLFILDRDWRFVYANPPGERAARLPREKMLGRTLWDAFPEILGTKFETEYRRAMKERARVVFEEHYAPFDRWFEASVLPSDEGLSIFLRDVTDRRRAEESARQENIARPLARRIVQDLVEQGAVAHQILTQVGRKLAGETPAQDLDEHLAAYRTMGLGSLAVDKREGGGRYSFSGTDLLERRPESRVATCSFTLGYLSEAVAHIHKGEPTLGTEIECQSRGAPKCRFIVQVKKPEEGLARRVKELI